tara:strand:+ start:858 stop:989 length:132 start_codon:yes stop_codon:yes gene_type:complete
MIFSKPKSITPIKRANIKDATSTRAELLCRLLRLGQVTLFTIS